MKTTPFQQALKNELNRIAALQCEQNSSNNRILLAQPAKRLHSKFSIMQFLRSFATLRISF